LEQDVDDGKDHRRCERIVDEDRIDDIQSKQEEYNQGDTPGSLSDTNFIRTMVGRNLNLSRLQYVLHLLAMLSCAAQLVQKACCVIFFTATGACLVDTPLVFPVVVNIPQGRMIGAKPHRSSPQSRTCSVGGVWSVHQCPARID
jgi:hypothetical protein